MDWIVRATRDTALRESLVASGPMRLVEPVVAPYLGIGAAGDAVAILMPDLSRELIAWEEPVDDLTLDLVLDGIARLHAMPWVEYTATTPDWDWPWCPSRERLLLLSRSSAERYRNEGNPVGERFLEGWDAFDRHASGPARALIEGLGDEPLPLLRALTRLPATGLHGDLKLANVAPLDDGRVALIDWQMMSLAPVAMELGWFLVSNSASLRLTPDAVMASYRVAAERAATTHLRLGRTWLDPGGVPDTVLPPRGLDATIGDWEAQLDLTWIVGLLLRGWRKGLDAEAGVVLPSGVTAGDDLAWWSEQAVTAAARRL
jgi:hypothetical protein